MCMIDCDYDRVTVLHKRMQRAIKPHRCMECGRQIDSGETYLCERYVFDGSASTHKTCEHCIVAREWLTDECGGFIYGSVEEDLREHAYEGYPMDVRRVAVGMAWQWRTPRGKLMPIPRAPLTTHERMKPHH